MLRLVVLSLLFHIVASARILGLFPYGSKSHFVVAGALMKGLASRGHEVYVLSHFPLKHPIANYIDISLVGSMPTTVNSLPVDELVNGSMVSSVAGLIKLGVNACENTLAFPPVRDLFESDQTFDLVVTEFFNCDCLLGFVHKLKVPYVAIGTSVILPWTNGRFGNPDNPSYMPSQFSESTDRMSFSERLLNTLYQEVLKWVYDVYITGPSQLTARRFFGESLPPLEDLARNASLLLLNTHFSISKPRPFVPAIVEVAGIHLHEPQTLPEDLQRFLDEARHGVVYLTLGSQVRVDSISDEKRDAFLQAFSQLPQRVLWKWEGGEMPGRPANVKLVKWLPQFAVLCHPAVRVFVTHAGLLGAIEAVHCGVPMVAVPLFGDQPHNTQCLVSAGVARRLDYHHINNRTLLHILTHVLEDPSYKENAGRLQKVFRDRPMKPLDTAIFWTEYVIRHGGAPHLRSSAMQLSWYQILLIDVVAVLLIGLVSVALLLYFLVRTMFTYFLRSRNVETHGNKKFK